CLHPICHCPLDYFPTRRSSDLDQSAYLINADNPQLIQLNKSNEHIAIVPGSSDLQLIRSANADTIDQLDVIFPIVHGTSGEDGSSQGMLRMANLPFVGPGVLSSAICMDKDIAKTLMKASGLNVAKSLTYTRSQQDAVDFAKSADVLGTPMFIKPANQGSSVGVSKVSTKEAFS